MLITESGKSVYNALFIVEYFLRELHKENYWKENCRSASFSQNFYSSFKGILRKTCFVGWKCVCKVRISISWLLLVKNSVEMCVSSITLFPTVLIVSSLLRPESYIYHHHRPNFHLHRPTLLFHRPKIQFHWPTLQLHRPKILFHRLKFSNWNLVSSRLWNNHHHFWAFWSVGNE